MCNITLSQVEENIKYPLFSCLNIKNPYNVQVNQMDQDPKTAKLHPIHFSSFSNIKA